MTAHLQHQALHTPVLLREVVTALAPTDGGTYLDATFGNGGYTTAILEAAACAVIAIDRDPDAIARGADLADTYKGRLTLHEGVFSEMQSLAGPDAGLDGIAFDLGVCSTQIDQPERGFSFRFDGPLDMRMSKSGDTAADIVMSLDERELAGILWEYGEERASRRIARAIVRARETSPITTTGAETSARIPANLPSPTRTSLGHFSPTSTPRSRTVCATTSPVSNGSQPQPTGGTPSVATATDIEICERAGADQLRPCRPRPAL